MSLEQVTLAQLFEADPLFVKWTEKPPIEDYDVIFDPWRVYVYRDGKWARRDFARWKKGLKFLMSHLDEFEDAALMSKVRQFKPPVVRLRGSDVKEYRIPGVPGEHPDHQWCGYCRRPTLMAHFSRHHVIPRPIVWKKRCTMCGYSREGLRRWT